MNRDLLWPFLLVGLSSGGLYALLGTSCVLVHRASGYLHIANSGIAMMTAVVYLGTLRAASLAVALPLSLAFGTGLAAALHRFVFSRLDQAEMAAKVVASVAAGIGLPAFGLVAMINLDLVDNQGSRSSLAVFPENRRFGLPGGATLTYQQAALPVAALIVFAVLQWILHKTDFGLALRASSQNPMSARLAGIPARKVTALTWAASGFIAALAGVLSLSSSSLLVPTYLFAENVRGLAAALAGGFVDLRRTLVVAMVLGVLENELVGFSPPWNELRGAVSFAVITVIALFGLSRASGGARAEATA